MSTRGNISVESMERHEQENAPQAKVATVEFDAKNYFDDRLSKGQTSKEGKVRILPIDKDSTDAFVTVHMHTIKLKPEQVMPGGSEWRSFVCLEKNEGLIDESYGHKCPFCELNREAYKKEQEAKKAGDEQMEKYWKQIKKDNQAKPAGISRLIDRNDEEHGPKFWKYNLHSDGTDPKNSIVRLWRNKRDESIELAMEDNNGVLPEDFVADNILDVDNGKDLKVEITLVPSNDPKVPDKRAINITDYGKFKPVSKDAEEMEAWINDEKVWQDVFPVKPYEYCSLIIDGKKPFKDKKTGLWVAWKDKDEINSEKNEQYKEANDDVERAKKAAISQAVQPTPVVEEDNDDLPY